MGFPSDFTLKVKYPFNLGGFILMKKATKIIAGIVTGSTLFISGTLTGANSNWKSEVLSTAQREIGGAGYDKKEELLTNADTKIANEMKATLLPTIQEQEEELAKLLEEYYQMKLDGLTETADFQAIEQEIETIKENVFERYKNDIDEAFEGF